MNVVRPAAFAGRFYPADKEACLRFVRSALLQLPPPSASQSTAVAGLVPHAGWYFSGSTAAMTIASIAASRPETVVIFGAVHVMDRNFASLFPAGSWSTPLGEIDIDEEVCRRIALIENVRIDAAIHAYEHSIEVELPFVQFMCPGARIVPLMIRPGSDCSRIGRQVAARILESGRRVAFVASTDLTHYGPAFGFEPQGRGSIGFRWAKDVNDRRFLKLAAELECDAVVPEVAIHNNACGSGAVAATLAAAIEARATQYRELRHTSSAEREADEGSEPGLNSVGYVSAVFTA